MKTYTDKQIEEKVKEIIIDRLAVVDEKDLEGNPSLSDLGADSLDTVEIIMHFEKEFGIIIDDDVAENIINIDLAVETVKKLMASPVDK